MSDQDRAEDGLGGKAEARRSAATCSAAPDTHGFWWWQRKDAERWEMVRVMDFGDGTLTAYSCEGSWGGWSLNVSPDRFAGKWVKISPPNESSAGTGFAR